MQFHHNRPAWILFLISQIASLAFTQAPPPGDTPPTTTLTVGKAIERELKGGESHSYSFDTTAGQFASVVVDQRGVDVVVVVIRPDNLNVAEIDSPNGTQGPEPVSLIAKMAGSFRIQVRSLENAAAPGRYEILLKELRAPTEQEKTNDFAERLVKIKSAEDRTALMAEHNFPKKELLKSLGRLSTHLVGLGDFTSAIDALLVAQQIAEQIPDRAQVAKALLNIGGVYHAQRNFPKALEFYQKSLKVSEDINTRDDMARALNNIGMVYHAQQNYPEAVTTYHKSLLVSEAAGLKNLAAQTTFSLGTAYLEQGEYVKALEQLQKSLVMNEALGDKLVMSAALQSIGNTHNAQGNYAQAVDAFQKSLGMKRELGDKEGEARSINGMGHAQLMQGVYQKALNSFQTSLAISEAIGDKVGAASTTGNIGALYHLQGDYSRALEFHQRSLSMSHALGVARFIVAAHINIGSANEAKGDYRRAIEDYQKALDLSQSGGDKANMAQVLINISGVFAAQGIYARALEYSQRALAINQQTENKEGTAVVLNNIGMAFEAQGKYDQALEYYQKSRALHEAIGNKLGATNSMENIGSIHHARGNFAQAMQIYRQAFLAYETAGSKSNMAGTLTNIALVYLEQGESAKALEYSERSVALAKQINSPALFWKAKTTVGKSYLALRRYELADKALNEAIATIEFIRSNFPGQAERSSYFSTVLETYQLYIDVLMQRHKLNPSGRYNAVAFQVSERARARSLLEGLSEARSDIRNGVDPQLLQKERSLQHQLNARAEQQTRLLGGKYTDEQAAALRKDIEALSVEYQDIESQIRQRSPRYASLTQPVPLDLGEIQREIVDPNTILLAYALGEKRSYLWLITKNSISSYELPPRSEIETSVRRIYSHVSNSKVVTDERIRAEYAREARRLSQILLSPVASQLRSKRVLIVADGALLYLPFGALPIATPGSAHSLVIENEIVNLPSASTLSVLRREGTNRKPPTAGVAIVADPVFSETDERLQFSTRATPPKKNDVNKLDVNHIVLERAFNLAQNDNAPFSIARLPFTRREAESIFANVPKTSSFMALDFEASRQTLLTSDLSQYRIVHFATHGILDSELPELSGLVLSLVNQNGEPVNGFLRLNEIYNMNLNADLVVLSACQTALGKEVKGEGLIGLTRGFMYAGSPRVIASLWKVDDVATAEFMKIFYQKMLKENMRPAAALRAAKITMMKQKRWSSPYYWAAFEMQGEWR